MYRHFFKSILGFFIGLLVILSLSTLLLLVTAILHYSHKGGGGFFIQERPGKYGKVFKVIKFKTMTDDVDVNGNLLPDEKRITKIGQFIRSTSLDELPQFVNVLKGDMSIIGPRPLLVKYLPLYSSEQAKRHNMRPGITGWAQCNGRNAISWTKRFELDIYYINNCSFILDLKILYLTLIKVFRREGISSETSITMEDFNGYN